MTTTSRPSDEALDRQLEEAAARLGRREWPTRPLRPGPTVSFEFFPPATPAGAESLDRTVEALAPLGPRFVSVTYGAGGTTQDRTVEVLRRLRASSDLTVAGHLTCVGATRAQVGEVVDRYLELGVDHIVALRGDPPEGEADGTVPGGYASAAELVAGLRDRLGDAVDISVGCYPEVHPRASSAQADLDNLKAKLDAGADRAISQFFFEADTFVRFLDRCRAAGITAPIVPGIMPVANFASIVRFAERCGTTVPDWMHDLFAGLDDAPEVHQLVAATVAAEQCRRLAEHGVTEFHFYTMNKPELTAATCRILGVQHDDAISAGHRRRHSSERAS